MARTHARYEFGNFALEVGEQRLVRLDTGESIPLAGKPFDTLVYLVEHPGELLDKDVLLHAIWPGVIVEENSLTQIVSTLRQCWAKRVARIATSRPLRARAIDLSPRSRGTTTLIGRMPR